MVGNYFYHESNIDGKCRDVKGNTYRRVFQDFIRFKEQYYTPYKTEQLQITGILQEDINRKVESLNAYYPHVDRFLADNRITSQSKFRPTVLEEFCGFLLKDIPEVNSLGLDFFNKKVFAGITLDNNGNAIIKTKDIDFCIGKQFDVTIGGRVHRIIIPIIAIECKTYIDKTMFSESQFTAQKMKQGSPNVRVYAISEENQIDRGEIPSKGQTPLDQIFIIRGRPANPINSVAIIEFFTVIRTALANLMIVTQINELGGILPD
jgi:hypothetical protein